MVIPIKKIRMNVSPELERVPGLFTFCSLKVVPGLFPVCSLPVLVLFYLGKVLNYNNSK